MQKKTQGERFGMTHFVNTIEADKELVTHLVSLTENGVDYTFE